MTSIAIIDYGMGNHRSVQKAIEHIGASAVITADPSAIAAADKVILPGVGAFRDAIQAIRDHHLTDVIRESVDSGKPFLGICLGLQLLFDVSYEDGEYAGLEIVPGTVQRFDLPSDLKIPHMGWNRLTLTQPNAPVFSGLSDESWFYFVHSYYVQPADSSWTAATTDYGTPFVSAVARDNVFAVQFHPEKSQSAGLQLLGNFVRL
ncbi:MAG: imidazole glycerol phosphate synthase subunit HisH [Planctomycetaceae bacterium]|nr:imidazole glycerol phosphate synthase subunit HisH [Planctomycetaceae bacterium]